ncbi:LysR family transcriptional regulator [Nocardioides endophyticus]|uniref:LysR family transcriptional regulator n=1 Tax=Nocardioides endophyticus TaxID=1353775 RepID=A0ABP8ZDD3_9ACTN
MTDLGVPDLDIETLRLLVAIESARSLSGAARARGLSQPSASARVKEFEARWGLSLVRRSARGSTLTEDGEAVVAWGRAVMHAADTMRASLAAMSAEKVEGVAVAASLTVAEYLLPRWLGELHHRQPDVRPRLHVVNSELAAEEVRSGVADIGFIETAVMPRDLARRQVGRDRMAVVVAPAHRWARRRTPLTRAEMGDESWVLRERGSGSRSTFESALRRVPNVAMEGTSTATLIGAAMAGVGPAVVSARSVVAEIETGRLVEVPTTVEMLRPLTAVWRAEERLRRPAEDLLLIAMESMRWV